MAQHYQQQRKQKPVFVPTNLPSKNVAEEFEYIHMAMPRRGSYNGFIPIDAAGSGTQSGRAHAQHCSPAVFCRTSQSFAQEDKNDGEALMNSIRIMVEDMQLTAQLEHRSYVSNRDVHLAMRMRGISFQQPS